MGAWGKAPWDNDDAADWFGDLFAATKLADRVETTLKMEDVEEYAGRIRAAAYLLVALGRVYVWPVTDLDRHLRLAIEKLEAISSLPDYEGDPALRRDMRRRSATVRTSAAALTTIMMTAMTCSPWSETLARKTIEMIAEEAIDPM